MTRYVMTLSYDGGAYAGFQIQPNRATVQERIESALSSLYGEKIKITASGRTDAGVHALGQVIHADMPNNIPPEKIPYAIAGYLPSDISVTDCAEVKDDFHAIGSCKSKTYRYSMYVGRVRLPLLERYNTRIATLPDIELMRKAAEIVKGTHDFKCAMATGSTAKTTVRTVTDIIAAQEGDIISLTYTADGFLYNMVRILSGAIVAVGTGKMTLVQLKAAIDSGERAALPATMPPQGLCLIRAEY